jgi:hypothetical protein
VQEVEAKTRRKWLKRMARTTALEPNANAAGPSESLGEYRTMSGCPYQKLSLAVKQAVFRVVMRQTKPLRNWKLTQKNRVTSLRYLDPATGFSSSPFPQL